MVAPHHLILRGFAGDLRIEPVEIDGARDVILDRGDVIIDLHIWLCATRSGDSRSYRQGPFFNEALCGGKIHPTATASEDGDFSMEFRCFCPLRRWGLARVISIE